MFHTDKKRALQFQPDASVLLEMLDLAFVSIGLLRGPELRWTYANRAMVAFTGRDTLADLLGKTIRESLPEVEGQGYFEVLDEVYRTGVPYSDPERQLSIGKLLGPATRYINFVCQPIFGSGGEVDSVMVHSFDVTAQVNARRALERTPDSSPAFVDAQRLAAIVESSDDAIISKDLNSIVTSWNHGAERLFGYRADEIVGRSILTIIPPELQAEEPAILENLRNGIRIDHYETERVRKDGTRVRVSLTISPLCDPQGRVIGASKIARDITEREQLQQAVIQSEKLAATGRMAAAIAHEINNPLEAVTNLAFLISLDPTLSQNGKRQAAILQEEIARVSNVARQSLGFFRDTGKPAEFDLCELLESVIALNRALIDRKHIDLARDFPDSCKVFGSAPEIRQVFSNLIRNAIEAVSFGGCMRIRVRSSSAGMQHVMLADNGGGIPPEIAARMFQPFATSKGAAGNGLGLWVSHGIVQRHGGRILFRTSRKPGASGTAFLILLPSFEGAFRARDPAAEP
ncbi:MAG: PAS domain S-box protein [Acidobacteriota bacterium]